jgi:hypothetical protein
MWGRAYSPAEPRGETEMGDFVSAPNTLLLLLVISTAFVCSGCNGQETIWSAEAKSPDGKVVAVARASLYNKGLSIISGIETNVCLDWDGDRGSPTLVLSLADASDSAADSTVDMRWLSPTHLEIAFSGNQTVAFQAVKWAGVDISVRDLKSEGQASGAVNLRKPKDSPQSSPPFAYQKTTTPPSSR